MHKILRGALLSASLLFCFLNPAAAYVGQFLASFQEYPQRQKVGNFNLDHILETLQKPASGSN
jgi:arylsulfatase